MEMLVIRGGRRLTGRVAISGSKNAALPIMAASLMIDGAVTLPAVPDLADVRTLCTLLASLGMRTERQAERLTLSVEQTTCCVAAYDLVRRMRASVCVLGPLLAKRGRAVVSLPGGCNIGYRPIDLHLKGLAALGADLRLDCGYVVGVAGRLRGAEIDLCGPHGSSVTGTANVLCAAVLARGRTILHGAACEPEVVDLARFLTAAGAQIDGAGTPTLEITGVDGLRPVTHTLIPDRIEAATLLIAAAITGGDVTLAGVETAHLTAVLAALDAAGVSVHPASAAVGVLFPDVRVHSAASPLRAVDVVAQPYPAFPTDVQAQWTALMCIAAGRSQITDQIFPDRFLHVPELARLGADVRRDGPAVIVQGPSQLRGANVMASDLRAGAALVLAALAAEGETAVRRIYHLDRGYERLDAKLAALGADVTRCRDDADIAMAPPLPASLPESGPEH